MSNGFLRLTSYIVQMQISILILWCYVIWYFTMISFHMKWDIDLWINSAGLSLIVGFALVLATGGLSEARLRKEFWQILRLFLCPFLVSSFSAVTKGEGFFLIFSYHPIENALAATLCLLALMVNWRLKERYSPT